MSLKAFHIVFIVLAALLCAVFGWWALERYLGSEGGRYLAFALVSFAGTVGLALYGRAFLKKMKDVSYL